MYIHVVVLYHIIHRVQKKQSKDFFSSILVGTGEIL